MILNNKMQVLGYNTSRLRKGQRAPAVDNRKLQTIKKGHSFGGDIDTIIKLTALSIPLR